MTDDGAIRWKQRLISLGRAIAALDRVADQEHWGEVETSALIHNFEVVFELWWKTLKDRLTHEGLPAIGPRSTLREAFAAGLITNDRLAFKALQARNEFAHRYDEELAEEAPALICGELLPMLQTELNNLREAAGDA